MVANQAGGVGDRILQFLSDAAGSFAAALSRLFGWVSSVIDWLRYDLPEAIRNHPLLAEELLGVYALVATLLLAAVLLGIRFSSYLSGWRESALFQWLHAKRGDGEPLLRRQMTRQMTRTSVADRAFLERQPTRPRLDVDRAERAERVDEGPTIVPKTGGLASKYAVAANAAMRQREESLTARLSADSPRLGPSRSGLATEKRFY